MINKDYDYLDDIDEKDLVEMSERLKDHEIKCPKCESTNLIKNGSYERYVNIKGHESEKIMIQRYICKDCTHHFKELPFYLVPNSHVNRLSLVKLLLDPSSINHLSKVYNLSRSSIKRSKDKYGLTKKTIRFRELWFSNFFCYHSFSPIT